MAGVARVREAPRQPSERPSRIPGISTATSPSHRRPPLGVVLDLGNVLVDWQPLRAIAAGVGEEEAARFLAADDFDFMAWNHGPDSGMTWDEAEDVVRREHPHWLEHALSYRRHFAESLVGEVPGTADVVRDLHAAGVPVWGLTNWSHELYPHAPARFEVLRLFDGVVVSGTEGVAKPDREAYLRVASRSGLPIDRLVFVDDKPDNVDAALASGMDAVVFTGAPTLRADLRVRYFPV